MSYRGASTVRGPLHFNGTASPGLSVASEGRIYFDGTSFQMSSNGGAFETIATIGAAGGWTDDGTVVRLTTVTDGVGIGTATPAASSKLEVLGDATRKDVIVTGGAPAAAAGGAVTFAGGTPSAGNNAGGQALMIGGSASGSGTGGLAYTLGGSATTGTGGSANLQGGTVTTGTPGAVNIQGGLSSTATAVDNCGPVNIFSGNSGGAGTGSSGTITIGCGNTNAPKVSGGVVISGGSNTQNGTGGPVTITGGAGATTGNITGGAVSLAGGAGFGSGTGGVLALEGGAGGATGAGGTITFTTGAGGSTSGASGDLLLASGTAASNSSTGLIGGETGGATGTGISGDVYFGSGPSVNGATGSAALYTGDVSGSGVSGPLSFTTGNSGTSDTGGILIRTGNAPSGTPGTLTLGTDGTDRWRMTGPGHIVALADNTYDIGAVGATRPRTVYAGTSFVAGNTITIGSSAISGSGNISLNAAASSFVGIGNTSNQAVQIGGSDSATHDTTPGVIFIQPSDGVGAGSYIAIYGSDANASQPGGFVDIRGGNGFATGDRAAGDLYVYGGGANGSTTAGPVYCEGGFGGSSAPGGLFEIKGGSTTLAAALAGDATIDGGTALSAADNGRVLIGGVNARSVAIGRTGITTTISGTLATGATTMGGNLLFTPDNTFDIGATGATRPRRVYVGTEVVVGNTVTIETAAVTGSGALAVNASSSSSLWLGSTGLTSIQVGPGSGFLPTPGTGSIVLYPVTGVVAQSFLGLYGSDGNASFAGGEIDIEAGLGFAGFAAGDVTMTGGGQNGGTRNGYLLIGINHTDRVSIGNATVFGGDNDAAQQVDISTGGRIWAGASGSAPIQVGSANGTFDALAGDIIIAGSPVVTGANYIGIYGGMAAAGSPGAYIDIIAGGGAPGLAAGDTFIRGGYADTGTAAGFLSLRGGDGNTTVSANYVLAEGGQTTAAAGFGGDAILRGGDNTTTPTNAGQVLIGVTTTRAITIGASGITTTVNGILDADGGTAIGAIATVSTTTTLDATYSTVLVDASGGAVTINLPSVTGITRRRYTIKKIDATANAVTIDAAGAETIDGATTASLVTQYDSIEIVTNGTAWFIV